MKTKNITRRMLLVGVLALTLGSCKDDFPEAPGLAGKTIAATMAADANFTLWTAVTQRVGIYPSLNNNNSGVVTIFAPSDPAMTVYLATTYAAQLPLPVTEASLLTFIDGLSATSNPTLAAFTTTLVPIINYHLISSKLTSSMITGTQTFATFSTVPTNIVARLSISRTPTAVYLNGNSASNGATVTNFDLMGSNGVAHTIDRVMNPIGNATVLTPLGLSINYTTNPTTIIGGTSFDAPDNNADFDLLSALIRYTGMVDDILPNATPLPDFTIFQANDGLIRGYFSAIDPVAYNSEAAVYNYISTITPATTTAPTLATLTDLVKYTVVPGRYLTQDITDGQVLATSLTGSNITVSVAPGPPAVYTLQDNNVGTNPVITTQNIMTNSGVLHTINQVLKPN